MKGLLVKPSCPLRAGTDAVRGGWSSTNTKKLPPKEAVHAASENGVEAALGAEQVFRPQLIALRASRWPKASP